MSLKLKALGLGLLVAMAIGAVGVMNAAATGGGHFVNDAFDGHAFLEGKETETEPKHQTELTIHGLTGGVICTKATYHGTLATSTETQVDVTPTYEECHTTGSTTPVPVDVNKCIYRFTVTAEGEKHTVNGTADLVCPGATKFIEVTHPNCFIRIDPQEKIAGVGYTTITEHEKHAITLEATEVQFSVTFEAKACTLLGTSNHTGTLNGSVTVTAKDTNNNFVNVTAT